MKTYLMPGHGDRDDYLRWGTWNWNRKYDLQTAVYIFGWDGKPDSYEPKMQAFERTIAAEPDPIAIVAVSASLNAALQAKRKYPGKISKIVGICGPVHKDKMDPVILHRDYPLVERSFGQLSLEGVPLEDLLVYYSPGDTVAPAASVIIEGADNRAVGRANHAITIGRTIVTRGKEIAAFIHGA